MARISYTDRGSSPFRRMVGHNPALLRAFEMIDSAITSQLSLPPALREEVRRVLAYQRGSQY